MTADAAPPSIGERRARWWSLLAIAALLPAAMCESARTHWNEHSLNVDRSITEVASGASGSYAGAEWRLSHWRVFADEPDPRLRTPPDRALVAVRLKARITQEIGQSWIGCRITLHDGRGRRWDPPGIRLPLRIQKEVEPGGAAPEKCSHFALSPPAPGVEIEMGDIFVVPRDALPTLEARYSVRGARPAAVQFEPPGR